MSALTAMRAGRAAAERLMLDTCTIVRSTGEPDELTGTRTGETVYAGPCKISSYEGYERSPEAGGHSFTVQRMSLHLPIGTYAPAVGDVATLTAAVDPNLTGRDLRMVQVAPFKSLATAYRIFVEEVTA